jgi:hypothetical protein
VKPWFTVGDRILCVDASLNRRCGVKLLTRGKIYLVRAIEQAPGWKSPRPEWHVVGWGLHLEGVWIVHPENARPWPIDPNRFRAVVDRPTDITTLRKLLDPVQLRLPLEEK